MLSRRLRSCSPRSDSRACSTGTPRHIHSILHATRRACIRLQNCRCMQRKLGRPKWCRFQMLIRSLSQTKKIRSRIRILCCSPLRCLEGRKIYGLAYGCQYICRLVRENRKIRWWYGKKLYIGNCLRNSQAAIALFRAVVSPIFAASVAALQQEG